MTVTELEKETSKTRDSIEYLKLVKEDKDAASRAYARWSKQLAILNALRAEIIDLNQANVDFASI
jgi:hypothetical protein